MEYFLEQFFDNWYKLYEIHGWWGLALVACVFAVMLPLNWLYIKVFVIGGKTEQKERLRKLTSSVSVFVLSGLAITIFTLITDKSSLTFKLVYQGAIPCGVLAMLLRAIYKLARDLGVKPLIKAAITSNRLKSEISKFVSNPAAINKIEDYIKSILGAIDATEADKVAEEEARYTQELAAKLEGLIESNYSIASNIINYYFSKGNKQLK